MKKVISIFLICFLFFSVSVPAFAASVIEMPDDIPLPTYADILNYYNPQDYNNLSFTDYDYIIYYSFGEWYCNVVFENSSNFYLYNQGKVLVDPDFVSPWNRLMMLRYRDGVWNLYGSAYLGNGSVTIDGAVYGNMTVSGADVGYSTRTIYYFGTDEVFFYQPPTLTEATGEALVQFQNQTTQTIMIILLCGVSCLALLISLPLLRKVFFRFLNR